MQAAGPWTLAAGLERTRGDRAVVDPGARRDLAQSLAEGLTAHVAAVAARVPGAQVVVQLDEPSVPAVLQGGLPTVSGFGKLPAVEASVVEQELAATVAPAGRPRRRALLRAADAARPLPGRRRRRRSRSTSDWSRTSTPSAPRSRPAPTCSWASCPGTDAPLPAPKATAPA